MKTEKPFSKRRKADNLIDLLRKLGLKSAKAYFLGSMMDEAAFTAAANMAINNFGKPDELYIDAKALADLRKALNPKKG